MTEVHAEHHIAAPRTYILNFIALLVLLVLTVLAAEIRHETWGIVVALLIAVVKAGLIAMIFMHLWWSTPLIRVFASAALLWMAILFTLAWSDFFTRGAIAPVQSVNVDAEMPQTPDSRH